MLEKKKFFLAIDIYDSVSFLISCLVIYYNYKIKVNILPLKLLDGVKKKLYTNNTQNLSSSFYTII